jgi:outer membrane protein insertion porin family
MGRIIFVLFLFAAALAPITAFAVPAASADTQSFLLNKVTATGSRRFNSADIVKATGLKPGATVTVEQIKQAASALNDTGVFSQVGYRYDGRSAEYMVVDAQQFIPATFENFIWYSSAELIERVHNSVPLFAGQVPLAGNLADQVASALEAILKEKNISGHVISTPQSSLGGPLESMTFQIDGLAVKIAEIRFTGAAPERVPLLQQATKKMLEQSYLQSYCAQVIKENAPQVYGRLGFLKAQFGNHKPVILKDDPAQPLIAIEVPVQEGDQYTFAGANWSGASVISTTDLAKTIDLKPGTPADTTQLARDIAVAKELYGVQGYMFAQVKSTATLDNEKHTAIFNLDVTEGPIYHMGKLQVQAPDPQRTELVKRVWEMHEGDVYNASYIKSFMKKHPRELSSLDGWFIHFTQTIHDDTHVVDLSLKFDKFQQEAR